MDRELSIAERRRRWLRRGLLLAGLTAAVLITLAWAPDLLRPSLSRSRIRVARVTVGPVVSTIEASGKIVPNAEQVVASPIDARVRRVHRQPGELLNAGDLILELDAEETILDLERLGRQIELKKNQKNQVRLDLENNLIGLDGQQRVKELDFKAAQANTSRHRELFDEGLVSRAQLDHILWQEEKVALELRELAEAQDNARRSTAARLEGVDLEIDILLKEEAQARRELQLASARANGAGVLTWVVEKEGTAVRKGDDLARIADMNTFRVEATISDLHAQRLHEDLPAIITIGEDHLDGWIGGIRPTIENGIITLDIQLAQPDHTLLKSNLRVDVQIVTARKERTLRVKRGPAFTGKNREDLFVIRGNKAWRTSVSIGLQSFDTMEIMDGLMEEDEIIISSMEDYLHMESIDITD